MKDQSSITALMSAFGRAFHAENEAHPVFRDLRAKELMTAEEYAAVQGYVLQGAQFFEPETDPAAQEPKALLRRPVNTQLAPSPLCRAAYTEQALKAAAQTGTRQYVILGAGLDTFAFREPAFLAEGRVFEVDHPLARQTSSPGSTGPAGSARRGSPSFLWISPGTALQSACAPPASTRPPEPFSPGWA